MEVQVTAFAFASGHPAVQHTLFYQYKLIYTGTAPLTDAYFGFFADPDLGDGGDDYVGERYLTRPWLCL